MAQVQVRHQQPRRPALAGRHLMRVALRSGQPGNAVRERTQRPVQRTESRLGLELDTGQTDHAQAGGGSGGVLRRARLADARFARQHQRPG
jgi:hypothetical protein